MIHSPALPHWEKHSSGVDVLFVEKHDRPLVSWSIVFPFGTYYDPQGKEGLGYLMGQMLTRGTKQKTREQIEETLDFLGTSIEVTAGAHSFLVEGEVLAKNLNSYLSLMMEVLTQPTFDEEELAKQKKEIISHLQLSLESDSSLAKRGFLKAVFGDHPYARDYMGHKKSIQSITTADLQRHFQAMIHQYKIMIGAAGSLDRSEFNHHVEKVVSALPAGSSEIKKLTPTFTAQGLNVRLIDKPDRSQTHFLIGGPCLKANADDIFPLKVFLTAFAGPMFQAKYMQEIRVVRGWSYGAYGTLDSRRDGGSWYLYTFPKVADTLPAIKLSLELLEKAIHGDLVTDTSMQFAKNYLSRSYPFTIDLPEKVLEEKIYGRLLHRSDDYLETYAKNVNAVTPDSARAAAQKYFDLKNLAISILGSRKDFESSLPKELSPQAFEIIPFDQTD